MTSRTRLEQRASALGFCALGVASAVPGDEGKDLRGFLAEGRQAGMGWLARDPDLRADPRRLLPGVRSVIVVGARVPPSDPADGLPPLHGRLARYARGPDYHDILGPRVRELAASLGDPAAVAHVDTGPVMEKVWAQRAGLGWIGKQSQLISRRLGPWLLLGVVLTRLTLEPDEPHPDHCGRCRRCVDACPTAAVSVTADGRARFDARRCRSYWTIEHRGPVPVEVRPTLGRALFGCDACSDACPWTRFARQPGDAPGIPELEPTMPASLDATTILALDGPTFQRRFGATPLARARLRGLRRNAAQVLGNAGDPAALPALERCVRGTEDEVVRETAEWAALTIGLEVTCPA